MTHGTKGYWKPISVIIIRGQILICLIHVISLWHYVSKVFFTFFSLMMIFYLSEGVSSWCFQALACIRSAGQGCNRLKCYQSRTLMLMRTWSWHQFQGVHIFMSQEKHTNMDEMIVKELINMHLPSVCIPKYVYVDSHRQTHTHPHPPTLLFRVFYLERRWQRGHNSFYSMPASEWWIITREKLHSWPRQHTVSLSALCP